MLSARESHAKAYADPINKLPRVKIGTAADKPYFKIAADGEYLRCAAGYMHTQKAPAHELFISVQRGAHMPLLMAQFNKPYIKRVCKRYRRRFARKEHRHV